VVHSDLSRPQLNHDGPQLYMGVAADCTYVSNYGTQANATSQILNNWNSASALYKVCFYPSLNLALHS